MLSVKTNSPVMLFIAGIILIVFGLVSFDSSYQCVKSLISDPMALQCEDAKYVMQYYYYPHYIKGILVFGSLLVLYSLRKRIQTLLNG